MRASDEDRERVITDLQQHTKAGRLTLDEFAERAGTVYAAKTLAELHRATVDLPKLGKELAEPVSNERQLLLTFLFAIIAVVVIGTFYALFH
ncbi:DUF1707 domain-containing protein [Dactylosporangium sp. AC04546]|uniref:DUF1707 SHOCT-like domain-containing protein n=1 Tax=Dactylosporangium sp. AC04546 TaxID=2862460 RepID=UPI001EDCF9D1|nr:DUF1707 domain-containing protein [Dactylosporangium sp. AC04546]WVK83148.1 DUF1707 domain-containing protein [Dactylosporangium sp. AC04546]